MKKFFRTIMMAMAALCLVAAPALAAEVSVSLPVEVTLEGTLPEKPEQFIFELSAASDKYPMPGGLAGGTTSTSVAGAAEGAFGDIVYDRVGIYTYTIDQVNGQNPDCTYDQRVYDVIVTVVNAENGEGFEATAVMYAQGSEQKQTAAVFHNVYVTVTPPPPGEVTDTGVRDTWYWYLIGAFGMMCFAAVAIRALREKIEDDAQPETAGMTEKDLAELAEDLDADFYEDENDKK